MVKNLKNADLEEAERYFSKHDFASAKNILDHLIKIQPKNSDALHLMGVILGIEKNHEAALTYFKKAIQLNPNNVYLNFNLARGLSELGNDLEAIKYYSTLIRLDPNNPSIYVNYGRSLQKLLRLHESIDHFNTAIKIDKGILEAWLNKGISLNLLRQYDEAIYHYDIALKIQPNSPYAHYNKGLTLQQQKKYNESINHFNIAYELQPNLIEAIICKGVSLYYLKNFSEALTCLTDAYAIDEKKDFFLSTLIHTKLKLCDWNDINVLIEKVIENFKEKKSNFLLDPFTVLSIIDDPDLQKKCAVRYVEKKLIKNISLSNLHNHKNGKIKIGYFSSNFNNHPVSYLTAELFELHDKNNFEIYAFSYGADDKSQISLRLRKSFDHFLDLNDKCDTEIIELSRRLNIDIAVDLTGNTENSRLELFNNRVAPVQISYLGYLGTSGCPSIDYIVTDKIISKNSDDKFFTEKFIYLPSYQVNDRKKIISNKKYTKKNLSLPEDYFIFCCFNNNYKILPTTFYSWMRILKSCPKSALYLYAENDFVKENLIKECISFGIDSERLIFSGRIPYDEYLARYEAFDLFLDTHPYNAGTTASDALWAGIPVITILGKSFASRMASSLLYSINLPELITRSYEEYENLAINIACNPEILTSLKFKLKENRDTALLFNTQSFTMSFETALKEVYQRHINKLLPTHIYIN